MADSTRVSFQAVKPEVVEQRLRSLKRNLRERRSTLEALFREAGCADSRLTEQRVPHSAEPSVLCTLPGETERTIVVGAHIDFIDRGSGAVDDWSGAALLPSLYQSLQGTPRRHRFVFAGFTGEEAGLLGSREYVQRLTREERAGISAMVNLECLGAGPPSIWMSRADKQLAAAYVRVARGLGQAPAGVNVDNVGDDDSHPFLAAKIPVITFHSVTSENLAILHSPRDTLAAIDSAQYYAAYRLAATYLAYVDAALDPSTTLSPDRQER
jgi:Zn-dependent M28 family amino/carboxypeptidase